MATRSSIKELKEHVGAEVEIQAWVSNKRSGKGIHFLILRDGSGFAQCVVSEEAVGETAFGEADQLNLESSVTVTGTVVADERQVGGYEIQATGLSTISIAQEYPISKKAHGVDFLMDHRHLWLRSRRQWAIMRIRNTIIFNIHKFFQEKEFVQMDAPIFTGNACEGTSTLFETDFYGDPAYLSQSGQLYGEAMAMAMGKIYTFGPTFRAEKSKTRRHLSEFWMIEPEMAFYNNDQNMDLIEEFLRYVVKNTIEERKEEMEIIERDTSAFDSIDKAFPRISYDDAVKILRGEMDVEGRNSIATLENDVKEYQARVDEIKAEIEEREAKINAGGIKKGEVRFNQTKINELQAEQKDLEEKLSNIPQWLESAKNFEYGNDLGGSDETVITRLFDTPVLVYNWPTPIKAFYMKEVEGNPDLVKGVDVLAPEGFGEIVGGGERETDENILVTKIKAHDLPMKEFEWYLDLRRYGTVPHAGFGLGLERTVAWICGLHHVRETIPLPRMYGRLFP